MQKIMLVIENEIERRFLAKIIQRLGYSVMSTSNPRQIAAELAESFPDVVFASIIGKSSQTLTSLAKVKLAKGIPKVVFVRNAKDRSSLTNQQKAIVDGLLNSPIDPFKLLEVLAITTGVPLTKLKTKYREIVMREQGEKEQSGDNKKKWAPGLLVFDGERKKKYDQICAQLKEKNKDHAEFNPDRFKELQKKQSEEIEEDLKHRELKKNFIKTLFAAEPKKR